MQNEAASFMTCQLKTTQIDKEWDWQTLKLTLNIFAKLEADDLQSNLL